MKNNNDTRIANLETCQANMGTSLKNLETQVGRLAHFMKESSSRSFPSDTENNPKDCMAITLRSGKELGNSKEVENEKVENEKVETEKQKVQMDKKEERKEGNKSTPGRVISLDKPSLIVPPLPFP